MSEPPMNQRDNSVLLVPNLLAKLPAAWRHKFQLQPAKNPDQREGARTRQLTAPIGHWKVSWRGNATRESRAPIDTQFQDTDNVLEEAA